MDKLKKEYNHLLKRIENGCIYLGEHKDEIPKYIFEMLKIVNDLGNIIDRLVEEYEYRMTSEEIERGFKDC